MYGDTCCIVYVLLVYKIKVGSWNKTDREVGLPSHTRTHARTRQEVIEGKKKGNERLWSQEIRDVIVTGRQLSLGPPVSARNGVASDYCFCVNKFEWSTLTNSLIPCNNVFSFIRALYASYLLTLFLCVFFVFVSTPTIQLYFFENGFPY